MKLGGQGVGTGGLHRLLVVDTKINVVVTRLTINVAENLTRRDSRAKINMAACFLAKLQF